MKSLHVKGGERLSKVENECAKCLWRRGDNDLSGTNTHD